MFGLDPAEISGHLGNTKFIDFSIQINSVVAALTDGDVLGVEGVSDRAVTIRTEVIPVAKEVRTFIL